MYGIGTRGKWKKKGPIDVLAFLCMLILTSGTPTSQPSEKTCLPGLYLTDSGICCNRCHQGYKLTKECQGEGYQSTCEPCEKGKTYNEYINYSYNCRSCTKCKDTHYQEEESECTTSKNAVCRCKKGFYKDVIDEDTFECIKCTVCGKGQKQEQNCTREQDTVCRCADGYYAEKGKCLLCERCTESDSCKHLCPSVSRTCKDPNSPGCGGKDGTSFSTALLIGVSATTVLLVVVGFITYKVTKDTTTRKLISTSSDTSASSVPPDSVDVTKVLIESFEEHADNVCDNDKAFPPSSVCLQDPSNLPDCIPKISELIYTVLHLVPVARVKELARKLDVPDIEIERAEADHRQSKEAHYQMLKVWADRGLRAGSGAALVGGGDAQQQPWLQELLAKLEDMNLGLAAEELEKKYSCQ